MKRVTGYAGMKLGFWKLESNSRYRKYKKSAQMALLNQFDQPTQFAHFSHLDPTLSAVRLPTHREDV
jgi:hypothetical protein